MFTKGDRVSWINGDKVLTGTVRYDPFPGDTMLTVNCDQVMTAGGIPIGRIERVGIDKAMEIVEVKCNG